MGNHITTDDQARQRALQGAPLAVLLIEDSPLIRRSLSEAIDALGSWRVAAFADAPGGAIALIVAAVRCGDRRSATEARFGHRRARVAQGEQRGGVPARLHRGAHQSRAARLSRALPAIRRAIASSTSPACSLHDYPRERIRS